MRQILTRGWRYLEADPGPILSLFTFITGALALTVILKVLASVLP